MLNSTLGSVVPLAMFLFGVCLVVSFPLFFLLFSTRDGHNDIMVGSKASDIAKQGLGLDCRGGRNFFEVLQCWQQHSIITLLMKNFTTRTK